MRNLDYELGRTLSPVIEKLANDTGLTVEEVLSRYRELTNSYDASETSRLLSTTEKAYEREIKRRRKPPVFVVGSKVHPLYHKIVKLRKGGMRVEDICNKLGVHRSRVYQILSTAKLTKGSNQHTKRDNSRLDVIKALAKAGYTAAATAKKLGITQSGVYHYAKTHGIQFKRAYAGDSIAAAWAKLTPEERKAEMKRRRAVALANKQKQATA